MIKKYDLVRVAYPMSKVSKDSPCMITTKEGPLVVNPGDYIATGIDGEHWVIDKDIFERTYERIDK